MVMEKIRVAKSEIMTRYPKFNFFIISPPDKFRKNTVGVNFFHANKYCSVSH
jgi:hypothetical protein